MTDLIGQVLLHRYRLDAFLGRGGMAEVYKAWDTRRSTFLALKMLRDDLAEDKVFIRRFKREGRVLETLQHPNIVRFYGLEQADGLVFILMDFIEGTSLRKVIFDLAGPLSLHEALAILRPVCAALHFAHLQGLAHCDIKPGNILMDRTGRVFVSDFGIARLAESATVTLAGAGTPAYMSPEQCRAEPVDARSDIYSLGIVLFEMLAGGERPFVGDTDAASGSTSEKVRWEQMHAAPPRLRRYNPGVPPQVEAAILRALAKEPIARFPDALTLLEAIENGASSTQPPELRTSASSRFPTELSPPFLARRRTGGVVLAAIASLVAILLIASIATGRRGASEPDATQTVSEVIGRTNSPMLAELPTQAQPASLTLTLTSPPLPTPLAPTPTPVPQAGFGGVQFCRDANCTFGSETTYSDGTREVYFRWEYTNMTAGTNYGRRWYVNGGLYLDYQCVWGDGWPVSGTFIKKVFDNAYGLAPGEWTIETYVEGRLQATASFVVTGPIRYEAFLDDYKCSDQSPTLR